MAAGAGLTATLVVGLGVAAGAVAAWTGDTSVNTPIAAEIDSSRGSLAAVSDGLGGAYVAWYESRVTRIERLTPGGELAWRQGPVILPGALADSRDGTGPVLPDGEGGLYVAMSTQPPAATRARLHRVRPDGSLHWGPDGVPLAGDAGDDGTPRIAPDGAGGVLAAWARRVQQGDWCLARDEVWAQRVGPDGAALWPPDGVPLCRASGERGIVRLAPDGAGGAWVGWQDGRDLCLSPFGYGPDVYLQHVDAGGATTLAPDGVDPDPDPNWQYFWGIAADGSGGAVLVYTEAWTATPRTRLHVQRVDAAGVPAWGADGRVLDDGSGDALALAPQLVADGGGGALVAWLHDRASGPHELRAARVDSSGMATWTRVVRDGVRFLTLVQRFDGDALLAWDDDPGTSQSDITAQRFDLATGAESWGPGGVLVTTARSIQHHPRVAPVGCATVLAWLDVRTSFSSVWAQRLDAQGAPGTAADALLFVEKSADDRDVALRWDGAERCTEWHVVRGGQGALLDARDLTPGGVPGPTWSDAGALHDARDAYYVIW